MASRSDRLKALEDRLNKEEALLQEFVRNPAQILKREGIELTQEQMKHIEGQVSKITNIPKTAPRPQITIAI